MTVRLTPDQVREKYGPMFNKGLFTLVDEKAGKVRIIETCTAKGPAEWDLVNRRRTGGVINVINLVGHTLVMDCAIGEKTLKAGPASAELGGQGVFKLEVDGDEVRTGWWGIAGASVGVGACLPQSPDVIYTEYPDDFKMGGGHESKVTIVTPKMVRVIIGVDDTDTKEKGATWAVGLSMARNCPYGKFLEHRIIQLNPKSPTKTTNCVATAVSFAVREKDVPALVEYCFDFIKERSYSEDAVMTVFTGLDIPKELSEFGYQAKSVMFEREKGIEIAQKCGVQIIEVTGKGGTIGAIAAIGCFDLGTEAAGVPEDFE